MAEAARRRAERARPDMQEHYWDLCKGWSDLAREIEATITEVPLQATGNRRTVPFPGAE